MPNSINSFKGLYQKFYKSLCVFGSQYISDQDVVIDIVQDVFEALWLKRKEFSKINNIKAFLYTSVKNRCLNEIKHQKVVDEYSKYVTYTESDFENKIIEEEVYRKLYVEINALPPVCKKTMLLALEGLSNKEIAEKLNVSVSTIKTQKSIAFSKIRLKFGEHPGIYFLFF